MSKDVKDGLKLVLYAVFDCVLQKYSTPFVCSEDVVIEELKRIVNDVSSKYYGHEDDYILYAIGEYDEDNGSVISFNPEHIIRLSECIDQKIRDVQVCIRTLNFLPNGYFKAPKEFQEQIQDKIDDAIRTYTSKFIEGSLDTTQQITSVN